MRERLDRWCERGSLAAVVAMLVFAPLATGAVLPWQFAIVQLLAAVALGLWLPRLWLSSCFRLFWPPVCWAVVGFTGYALIRYWTADLEFVARKEVLRVLVYGVAFFVLLNNLSRKSPGTIILHILLGVATLVAMYGIYQYASESRAVWWYVRPDGYGRRASGTYICPNHFAGFLGMLLPVGVSLALLAKGGPLRRIFLVYACLVILVGLGLSVSRAGWVAAGTGILVVLAYTLRGEPRLRLAVLLGVVLLGGLASYGWSQGFLARRRVQELFEGPGPQQTMVVRSNIWYSAYRMWQDHPWLGVGPAHFDYRFPAYRTPAIQARPQYVHNDYLNALADWGMIGAGIAWAGLVISAAGVRRALKYFRRPSDGLTSKPSDRLALTLGLSAGWIAVLVHALTDFNLQIPANGLVAVVFLALLARQLRFTSDQFWRNPRLIGRVMVTLAGAVCVVVFVSQSWQRLQEDQWRTRAAAERALEKPSWRVLTEALEQAAAIESSNFETCYQIGEAYRWRSWAGDSDYRLDAERAIKWFEAAARLNPYDPYNLIRIGMCLDWLGRRGQAAPYYTAALRLDPNNYYLVAHQGWHYVQTGDLRQALACFERSLELKPGDNPIAWRYRNIVSLKLQEQANPPPPRTP
jgi:O-antigen ligase